mmetsp:Transcript_107862/g.240624  ORF Transcript_107862/g.240624 Transcript_107862/m.240624 type:complete len:97 (+) Transcript_107862:990-1280(+)
MLGELWKFFVLDGPTRANSLSGNVVSSSHAHQRLLDSLYEFYGFDWTAQWRLATRYGAQLIPMAVTVAPVMWCYLFLDPYDVVFGFARYVPLHLDS